jgi:hypothetical protein
VSPLPRTPRGCLVRPLAIDLGDRVLDLLQQAGKDFTIRPRFGGDLDREHVLGVGINGQMDLALDSPLAHSMLTHLPVAFTVNTWCE